MKPRPIVQFGSFGPIITFGPILLILSALFAAVPLRAQTLVQPAASQDCGSSQSCTAHLAASVTAGSSLIAVVRLGRVSSISGTTITDSLANTWVLDAVQSQTHREHTLAVYRVASAKAGDTVFSVSNDSAWSVRIVSLVEVTGISTSAPDDAAAASGTGKSAAPGSLNSSQAGDYILLAASTSYGQSYATAQPFSIESQVTRGAAADSVQPQAAAISPSITFNVSDDWAAIALAYKSTGLPKLPINLTLQYDDGSPVTGTAILSSLANNTKTTVDTWAISGSGQATIYCPRVNTGTYEYDFLDSDGNVLQSYVVFPGAFISLITPAHSAAASITLSKNSHNIVIPVSFAFQ